MPKINQEEYEILKELDDKWKWIARDGFTGIVNVYEDKPRKIGLVKEWTPMGDRANKTIFKGNLFQFIQWEGGEPYSIAELIEEYESEETEVKKDIEWLKNEVNELPLRFLGFSILKQREEFTVSKDDVLDLINQLDEPEVLSQEWIDEHLFSLGYRYPWKEAVPVDDLQNLLVPKQEITEEQAWEKISEYYPVKQAGLKSAFEHFYYGGFMTDVVAKKPVIPKFVAEYLPLVKQDIELEKVAYYAVTNNELAKWKKEYDWIRENFETFVRAWLDGFTVEKEQKYYVKIMDKYLTDKGLGIGTTFDVLYTSGKKMGYQQQFTEQEIKDYDPRSWPFAVKVEELEE